MEKIDGIMLNCFIKENFKSHLEFSRQVGLSYSHLYYILKEHILVREGTLEKLDVVLKKYGVSINDFVYPKPLIMNGKKIGQIDIYDNGELICSISTKDIIHKDKIKVKCRPY